MGGSSSGEGPLEEPPIGVTEWRFKALALAGGETVKGHGEVVDAND
jgi:hypothetical protein